MYHQIPLDQFAEESPVLVYSVYFQRAVFGAKAKKEVAVFVAVEWVIRCFGFGHVTGYILKLGSDVLLHA